VNHELETREQQGVVSLLLLDAGIAGAERVRMHRVANNLILFFRDPSIGLKACHHPPNTHYPFRMQSPQHCLKCAVRVELPLFRALRGLFLFSLRFRRFAHHVSHSACELAHQSTTKSCTCLMNPSGHFHWQCCAHQHRHCNERGRRRER